VITARLTRPVRRMTKEIRAMARDAGLAGDKLHSPRSVGNQWLAS